MLFPSYVAARPQPQADSRTQRLADKLPFPAVVLRVNDGDTICVERIDVEHILPGIEYIRLAGIDAPELRGANRQRAIWSRDALAQLILGLQVTIQPTRIWRDPYSRIIARVRLGGVDVGAWLIQSGHAKSRRVITRTSRALHGGDSCR